MADLRMLQKKIEISFQELMYYFFLIIMFTIKGLGLYDGQLLYKLFFMLAFLCIGIKLLFEAHSYMEWFFIIGLAILVLVMNRQSGEKGPLIIYALLIGMKGISLDRIMKIGIYSFGGSTLLCVLFHLVKMPFTTCFEVTSRFGIQIGRWTLGYPHPNTTAVTYLALITMIVYCLGEKYDKKHMLWLMLGNIFINFYCVSYTGFIVCSLYLVLAYYWEKNSFSIKRFRILIMSYVVVCISFLAVLPFCIPPFLLEFIRNHFDTLHSRIRLSKEFLTAGKISLFGVNVANLTDSRFTLDNSYLYSFVFNGVLFSIFMLIIYLYGINYLIREGKKKELLIVLALMTEGIMEPFLFNTSFKNTGLFILGAMIWGVVSSNEKAFGIVSKKMISIPVIDICPEEIGFSKNKMGFIFVGGILGIFFWIINYKFQGILLPEYVTEFSNVGTAEYFVQVAIECMRNTFGWLFVIGFLYLIINEIYSLITQGISAKR